MLCYATQDMYRPFRNRIIPSPPSKRQLSRLQEINPILLQPGGKVRGTDGDIDRQGRYQVDCDMTNNAGRRCPTSDERLAKKFPVGATCFRSQTVNYSVSRRLATANVLRTVGTCSCKLAVNQRHPCDAVAYSLSFRHHYNGDGR